MERSNLRSAAYDVIENYLEAAAKASKTAKARAEYVAAIQAIPEERAMLRGLAAKSAMKMASSIEGLRAVLPTLYSQLVGASVLGRAYAATALSEIPSRVRQNLPALVYEAFCVLLQDQFIAVHKSAVRALRRISLPEDLRQRAALALFQLVSAYADGDDQPFLVDCIVELARLAEHLPQPEKVRELLCHAALKAEPIYVQSEIRSLRNRLKDSDDFPLLVAHVLPAHAGSLNGGDDEARLIKAMSPTGVLKHKTRLVEVAKQLAEPSMWLSTLIADSLHRSGARGEAVDLLEELKTSFEATIKDRQRALFVSFPLLAYRMEEALGQGDTDTWVAVAEEWQALVTTQKALLEDRRARDSRSRFSFPD